MEQNKITGKYKEFTYEIREKGWTIFHRHFRLCHVYDATYPFVFNKKTKRWLKGFNIDNKKHIYYVRNHIYKCCEEQLKNRWWRDLK